jgi:GAF domain-containing protein
VTTPAAPAALAAISRLGADLAAGADSTTLVETLVEELARPLSLDFSIRYELAPEDRALRLHTTTGVGSQHLPALEVVPLGVAVCGVVAEQRRPEAHSRVDADPDERLTLARELDATTYASFPLTAGPSVLGTLSVGSRTRPAFDPAELTVLGLAAELVTVAAVREQESAALDAARAARDEAEQRSAQLQTALGTNRTIGMAIGIVMARTGQTSEQAHAALVTMSQQTNRKLRDLADRIVLTGSVDVGPVSAATAAAAPAARRRSPRTPSSPTARP